MIIINDLKRATFISRPNRFIVIVNYNGEDLRCHLPNPGRMIEILEPNVSKLLIKFTDNQKRKTRASVVAALLDDEVIQLNSNLVSNLIPNYLSDKTRNNFIGWKIKKSEVTIAMGGRKHRLDYLFIDDQNQEVYVEIKSTTLVRDSIACFPDAVSERASRHLDLIKELVNQGRKCAIIFVIYRRAKSFTSCNDIDPVFAKKFNNIKSKIKIFALQAESILNGSALQIYISRKIPVT